MRDWFHSVLLIGILLALVVMGVELRHMRRSLENLQYTIDQRDQHQEMLIDLLRRSLQTRQRRATLLLHQTTSIRAEVRIRPSKPIEGPSHAPQLQPRPALRLDPIGVFPSGGPGVSPVKHGAEFVSQLIHLQHPSFAWAAFTNPRRLANPAEPPRSIRLTPSFEPLPHPTASAEGLPVESRAVESNHD